MKIRSFIAINLPAEIKKHLLTLLEELRRKNYNLPIKWVRPEGLHLTLHFLGYQDEMILEKIKEIVAGKIKKLQLGQNIPRLFMTEIDAFPSLLRPRVLFIGCQEKGSKNLIKKLQREIGQKLEKLRIEVDTKNWVPHITLGRFKVPTKFSIFNFQFSNLSFEVKSIDLMKSELTPTGAKYSILKKISF